MLTWCWFVVTFVVRTVTGCLAHAVLFFTWQLGCQYFKFWKSYDIVWFWTHLLLSAFYVKLRPQNYFVVFWWLLWRKLRTAKPLAEIYREEVEGIPKKKEGQGVCGRCLPLLRRDGNESELGDDKTKCCGSRWRPACLGGVGSRGEGGEDEATCCGSSMCTCLPACLRRKRKSTDEDNDVIQTMPEDEKPAQPKNDEIEMMKAPAGDVWTDTTRTEVKAIEAGEAVAETAETAVVGGESSNMERNVVTVDPPSEPATTGCWRCSKVASEPPEPVDEGCCGRKLGRTADAIDLALFLFRFRCSLAILFGNFYQSAQAVILNSSGDDNVFYYEAFKITLWFDIGLMWITWLWFNCRQCYLCCRLGCCRFFKWGFLTIVIGALLMELPMNRIFSKLDYTWCAFAPKYRNSTLGEILSFS